MNNGTNVKTPEIANSFVRGLITAWTSRIPGRETPIYREKLSRADVFIS